MREIVFDTETTGLDFAKDRVIEIGGTELWNHIPTGREFHRFICPQERKVDPGAFNIHGLSDDFLRDKPVFAEVVDEFLDFFEEATLIAHNGTFDMRFINAELVRLDRPAISLARLIDTLPMARRKFPMAPVTLDALCSRFSIDTTKRDKHGALIDSELLAQVYIELIGGRQSVLRLVTKDEARAQDDAADGVAHTLPPRPALLATRLTLAEIEAHRTLVASLGKSALWRRIKGFDV